MWLPLFVISVLAIIQSIFGVGLLMIGTPILILLGYSFDMALSFLLPSSIVISALQLIPGNNKKLNLLPYFCIFGLPFVVMGVWTHYIEFAVFNFNIIIGFMLVVSALLRMTKLFNNFFEGVAKDHEKTFIIVVSFVHGLTNMGGALLSIWASYKGESKLHIRTIIAQGYILFASTQLVMMFLLKKFHLTILTILLPLSALFAYAIIGRYGFNKVNTLSFNWLLSIFMLSIGLYIILKSIG